MTILIVAVVIGLCAASACLGYLSGSIHELNTKIEDNDFYSRHYQTISQNYDYIRAERKEIKSEWEQILREWEELNNAKS